MAGHNKWTQIKRQKGVEDAKRARLFSQLSRAIGQAAAAAGDRDHPAVKRAIEAAKAANMPAANIERAISKARGGDDNIEPVRYEAYGPGGAALVIEAATPNPQRLTQELKHLLGQYDGRLAKPGTALWAFQKTAAGWITKVPAPAAPAARQRQLTELVTALTHHPDIKTVVSNAL